VEQPKINFVAIIGLTITSLLFFGKISGNYAKLEGRLSVIEWKLGEQKEDINNLTYSVNQQNRRLVNKP
jgi:hypothetical protein